MIKKHNGPENNAHRVITFLTREELDFLDKLGKDALFSAGCKLSRSKIISAMVNVIRKLNIDGRGLTNKKELENKIIQAIKQIAKTMANQNVSKAKQIKERQGGGNETFL